MKRSRQLELFLCILPVILLCIAALPLFTGAADFSGDDNYYIRNPLVTSHSLAALREIWTRPLQIEYFPLTITTYAVEHCLWGNTVKLYRLTNLILFIVIGMLSLSLSRRFHSMLRPDADPYEILPWSILLTAIVLLHPVNVESLACISNRKELLFALFSLLALRSFLSVPYGRTGIILTILSMLLAQLSKGSAVILTVILGVTLFVIPRETRELNRRIVAVIGGSLMTALLFLFQYRIAERAGVIDQQTPIPFISRVAAVIRTIHTMLSKILLPRGLTYDYDIPWPHSLPPVTEWILPLSLAAVLVLLLLRRGGILFALSLLPLIAAAPYANIIPLKHDISGKLVFYDHYLLLPLLILPSILIFLVPSDIRVKKVLFATGIGLMLVMTPVNYLLASHWRTRETLYLRMIETSPNLPKAYLFLAKSYEEQKRYLDVIRILLPIIERKDIPVYLESYLVMANAQFNIGNLPLAEQYYRRYLAAYPTHTEALKNLTAALLGMGRCEDAIQVIDLWAKAYPYHPLIGESRRLAEKCEKK